MCQGHCHLDSDCAGNLQCFKYRNLDSTKGDGLHPKGSYGLCQGDYDHDDNCAGTLKCFQRDGYAMVPGCAGTGRNNWDYCIDPEDLHFAVPGCKGNTTEG